MVSTVRSRTDWGNYASPLSRLAVVCYTATLLTSHSPLQRPPLCLCVYDMRSVDKLFPKMISHRDYLAKSKTTVIVHYDMPPICVLFWEDLLNIFVENNTDQKPIQITSIDVIYRNTWAWDSENQINHISLYPRESLHLNSPAVA